MYVYAIEIEGETLVYKVVASSVQNAIQRAVNHVKNKRQGDVNVIRAGQYSEVHFLHDSVL